MFYYSSSLFFVFLCSLIHLNHEWTFSFLFVFMYLDLSMLSRGMHTIICWYDGHLIAFKYLYISWLNLFSFDNCNNFVLVTLYQNTIRVLALFCWWDWMKSEKRVRWGGKKRWGGKERRVEMGLIWTVWNCCNPANRGG